MSSASRTRLGLESLEARDVPSVVVVDEKFDTVTSGLPAGWGQYSPGGATPFAVAATGSSPTPVSGARVLAFNPPLSTTTGIVWSQQSVGPDATVTVAVNLAESAPTEVIARASNLNSDTPTYYAASIKRGLTLELFRVVNGTATAIGTPSAINSPSPGYENGWVRVSLDVSGATVRASVQRVSDGQYLAAGGGGWQAAQAWALNAIEPAGVVITAGDLTGIRRRVSNPNAYAFDDFKAEKPDPAPPSNSYTQNFNSAPPALPADWAQWTNAPSNAFSVAAPSSTVFSRDGNALASSAPTGKIGQAWQTTSRAADVTVSTDLYLQNLKEPVLFARGSNLAGAAPSYYSASVTGGAVSLRLSKTVNGIATALPGGALTLQSGDYTSNVWAKLTLDLSGQTVRAKLQRLDTMQFFVNSGGAGVWQASEGWGVTATGQSDLAGGGFVGVARTGANADAVSFDNFTIGGSTAVPPTVPPPPAGSVVEINQASFDNVVAASTKKVYELKTANTTYRLTSNISAPGSAFALAAKDVTLDLNGKTVTYDAAPNPVVPNADFEEGGTTPSGWVQTGPATAMRVPKSSLAAAYPGAARGLWGNYVLEMANFNPAATQTLTSGLVTVEAGREYAAAITVKALGESNAVRAKLEVLNAGGQVIPQGASINTEESNLNDKPAEATNRGFGATFQFVPSVTQVKLRLTISLDTSIAGRTPTATVYIDHAMVRRSRESGVIASQSGTYIPAHLQVPGYLFHSDRNFVLKNGAIRQADDDPAIGGTPQGGSYASPAINAAYAWGMKIDGVDTYVNGPDTSNLYGKDSVGIEVRNSTYTSGVNTIHNRQRRYGSMDLEGSSNIVAIADNYLYGSPMYGIILAAIKRKDGFTARSLISGNYIYQNSIVADGYGIMLSGMSQFDVTDNHILPVAGRGLLVENQSTTKPPPDNTPTKTITENGLIQGNTFESREKYCLEYTGGQTLEATGIRLRNQGGSPAIGSSGTTKFSPKPMRRTL